MRFPVVLQIRTASWRQSLLTTTIAFVFPLLAGCGNEEDRVAQSQNNLKQIGVGLFAFESTHKAMPPWAACDKDGKPLLSWRVLILPYFEQTPLYRQFKLDEPWDSPHNSKLLEVMPAVYAAPGVKTAQPGLTFYQGFVGKGAGWELILDPAAIYKAKGIRLKQITAGRSKTIAVIEASEPVPWTKPADLPFEKGKPLPAIGGVFKERANALMFDGSVTMMSTTAGPALLQAAVTREGKEPLAPDWNED
jgi:prepilin-type processing-associated H-X9-DG protein